MTEDLPLVPLLIVRDAPCALDFYVAALGATVLTRYQHGPDRHISHADLVVRRASDPESMAHFAITEEARAWNSDAPISLGGSPVVLQLSVDDADAAVRAMCAAGARVVFPVREIFGERMARVCDPFGHLWIVRQQVQLLSPHEIQRQRDDLFARAVALESKTSLSTSSAPRQAPARVDVQKSPNGTKEPRKASVHLIVGPVGAGKSTFGLQLVEERNAVRLTLDDWMTTLFRPDRPETGVVQWYVERSARAVEQIWTVAQATAAAGTEVVLEIGLLRRPEREAFTRGVRAAGFELVVYVLDAPRDVRRERVARRNRDGGPTFSMPVPPEVFELASDFWEPLEAEECDGLDVRFLDTGRS